jgi:hypothetical protein
MTTTYATPPVLSKTDFQNCTLRAESEEVEMLRQELRRQQESASLAQSEEVSNLRQQLKSSESKASELTSKVESESAKLAETEQQLLKVGSS